MGFSLNDFLSDLTHQFSSSVSPTQSANDAGTAGDRARAAANAKNTTLSQDFHGDYTPEVVSAALENFEGMSHDRIIQYRDSVVPNDMTTSVTAWQTLADTTNKKAESFRTDIEALINNGWAGATAESAKTSVRKYAEDVHGLQNAANLVANKLSDANATLTQVKGQIPDKARRRSTSLAGIVTDVVATVVTGGGTATLGGQLMADHGRANNAQNEARSVMQNVYAKYLPEADKNVPKMPGVTTADKPGGATGPTGPSSTAQSYSPTYQSTATSYGPSASSGASSSSGTSTSPSSYSSSSSGWSSSSNPADSTTGTSSATSSMSSYSPNSTSTAGYGSSGTGTTGGGGFNSGTTGGGAGSSIPGTTSGTNAAATVAANSAKSTSGLTNSMMPHGQSKKEGDEAEHKTADYLRGIQEELVGPEPKLLPGGVIGGEYADE